MFGQGHNQIVAVNAASRITRPHEKLMTKSTYQERPLPKCSCKRSKHDEASQKAQRRISHTRTWCFECSASHRSATLKEVSTQGHDQNAAAGTLFPDKQVAPCSDQHGAALKRRFFHENWKIEIFKESKNQTVDRKQEIDKFALDEESVRQITNIQQPMNAFAEQGCALTTKADTFWR